VIAAARELAIADPAQMALCRHSAFAVRWPFRDPFAKRRTAARSEPLRLPEAPA
jgi:hypothetical protein